MTSFIALKEELIRRYDMVIATLQNPEKAKRMSDLQREFLRGQAKAYGQAIALLPDLTVTLQLDNLIPPVKAARILGISRQTLWRWVISGKIRACPVGWTNYIPQSEIERLSKHPS